MVAEHAGMCFGVRDAIDLANEVSDKQAVTILGDLAHNPDVMESMKARGIESTRDLEKVRTQTVMITAHGASRKRIEEVRQRGHQVIEATCPLVRVAHDAAQRLERDGYFPVVIGKADHVEVQGLTGDLKEYEVILTEVDARSLAPRKKFGIVAQTTQPLSWTLHLVEVIRSAFPESEVRHIDTVCRPTKQRQKAAIELAEKCDVVVVIGGKHSNNTGKLAETCGQFGAVVHRIERPEEIRSEWFHQGQLVGLTGGTSTPPETLFQAEQRLKSIQAELNSQPVAIIKSKLPSLRKLSPVMGSA